MPRGWSEAARSISASPSFEARNTISPGRKLFDLEGDPRRCPRDIRSRASRKSRPTDLDGETIVALGPDDEFRRKLTQALDGAGLRYRSMIDASLGITVCALVAGGMRDRHRRQRGGTGTGAKGAGVSCVSVRGFACRFICSANAVVRPASLWRRSVRDFRRRPSFTVTTGRATGVRTTIECGLETCLCRRSPS